ncbi:protein kinase family protein [Shewanella baltica]|uniref:protein kinase family protein n=1 Tax=Shewanella baltica TaxID=62322 RepID=UPI003CFCAA96
MEIVLDHKHDRNKYSVKRKFTCDGIPYEIGDFINFGGNAIVHECTSSRSADEFAIKFQIKNGGRRGDRFKQEMDIHKRIKHPHLVNFIGCGSVDAQYKNRTGRYSTTHIDYVIMDRCESNLQDYIKSENKSIPYSEYIGQFRGLVGALKELHTVAVHRDIKPSNILIKDGIWKLSDFGLCAYIDPNERNDFTPVDEKIGPANWMSPESNSKFAGYDTDICAYSDVFQLASVFWMIVNQKHPTGVLSREDWKGPDSLFEVLFSALQHCPSRRPKDGDTFSSQIMQAIEEAAQSS